MSKYLYQGYNKENKIIHGEYESSSEKEVVEYLNAHSLIPISIKPFSSQKNNRNILDIDLFDSITSVDLVFLVRNLSTTIKAGLSIIESLDILIKDSKKKLMKKILIGIHSMIENGQTMSYSFENYSKYFPPIFIGMVRAGEASGQLDKNLSELARYLSKEYILRGKVKSALTYPIILLLASVVIVILMLVFVLPKLIKSFAASNVPLPWVTKMFIGISNILTWSYLLDVILILGIIFFFTYFRSTKIGKKFFFSIYSNLPVARDLIKKIALVRFSRTFGNLIGSGLSIVESLKIASSSVDNIHYSLAITTIIEDIKNGIPISESINKYPKLFPNLLVSLITVGEKTGSLEEILITFSDFYEEEVDNQLKELTSVLEPALLLVMGLMIGAIAVSIILPIYQLTGNFV